MAGGGGDLNARMSAEDQNGEERLIYETIFNHFKRNKVEISSAIKKTFPFLEGLRDRELITNKMFEDSQDSCRNLVPVQRVVYNVLNELEKTFNLTILEALFSEVNMQEYPDLIQVYKSFENAIQDKLYPHESDDEEREERSDIRLSIEQGTGENSLPSLTWSQSDPSSYAGTTPAENGPSESLCETEQIKAKRKDTTSDKNDALGSPQASKQCAQESEPAGIRERVAVQVNNGDARSETPSPLPCAEQRAELPSHGVQINSCSVLLVDIKKEPPTSYPAEQQAQARVKHNLASDIIVISSEDSEGPSDGEEPPKASTSVLPSEPVINNYNSWQSSEGEEDLEDTYILPQTASGMRYNEDSSESTDSELIPGPCNSALRNPVDIRGTQNRKRRFSSDSFPELNNEEEPQETSSSALRRGSGVPGGQEARTESSQASDMMDTMDVGNNPTLGKHSKKISKRQKRSYILTVNSLQREKRRGRGRPRIHSILSNRILKRHQPRGRKGLKCGLLKRRRRGPRIPRDRNINFQSPELPVTCGKAKGTLYKDKLKQGASENCVQSEDGRWFTPRKFEIEGGYAASKNWKLSLRCGGHPLKHLMERGFLPCPPRTRKQRKTLKPRNRTLADPRLENSNVCEVCRMWGRLFCCDTCPRSFHENCHIPSVETERNPWSCTFCITKSIQEKCPKNQPCHQESEVLMREMLPEEQLKCEWLLLKVYCCSKSSFFVSEPSYQSREGSQGPQEPMWLDKIKKRLNEKVYPQVEGFVRDMRLIFQNHRMVYRGNKFINLGLQLEDIFEKNFKNIFAVQETSKTSSQFGHIVMLM